MSWLLFVLTLRFIPTIQGEALTAFEAEGAGQLDSERALVAAPQVSIPVVLSLNKKTETASDRIYLGEISGCKSLPEICEEWYWVDLGPVPVPGGRMFLKKGQISQRVAEEFPGYRVRIEGPRRIEIKGEAATLNQSDVFYLVENKLKNLMFENLKVLLDRVRTHKRRPIRPWRYKLSLVEEDNLMDLEWRKLCRSGRISLRMKLDYPDYPAVTGDEFHITGYINCLKNLFVAKTEIPPKLIIRSVHLDRKWVKAKFSHLDILHDKDQIVGFQLKSRLGKGGYFRKYNLEKPILVERGKSISIVIDNGGVSLTTRGKAGSNGSLGDSILVKHPVSNKKVYGVVVAKSKVRVKL